MQFPNPEYSARRSPGGQAPADRRRIAAMGLPAGYVPPVLLPAILFLATAGLALFGCGDNRVAGTSSGVDNPQLTVAFQDSTGKSLRVTGDLNLYGRDQNPAVDPEPLWTIKLNSTAIVNLTADDIARINSSPSAKSAAKSATAAAAKVSASQAQSAAASDSILAFNLELKTNDRRGMLTFGLAYDSATGTFSQTGGPSLSRLDMKPRPLVRYQARIARDSLNGVNRVFIPGTPFQATLVDSVFVLEDLPEGVFPLRFLTGDGRVYAVKESLDTKVPLTFTPGKEPVATVDSTHKPVSDSGFAINAGPDREAFSDAPSILEAQLINGDPKDPRLSVLWRQILRPGDTSMPLASIANPTSLQTGVTFKAEGAYPFEVSATLGLLTVRDTVQVSVRQAPPAPQPRIIQPRPNDTLILGQPYPISWEMPTKGPVTLSVSANGGETWTPIATHFVSENGPPIFNWTPAQQLAGDTRCLIEVRLDSDSTQVARSSGFFSVTH